MNAVANEVLTLDEEKYTFPSDARIEHITFDASLMHVHLTDGRILSIPLQWVPSLAKAQPDALAKYHLGNDATTIHWDNEEDDAEGINEYLRLSAYMGDGSRISLNTDETPPPCAEIRKGLGLTQQAFADRLGVSVRTIQEWEQGRNQPSGPALTLLRVAYQAPKFFLALDD